MSSAFLNWLMVTPFALVTIPVGFGLLMLGVHLYANRKGIL